MTPLADDEVVFRHVPPGTNFQVPPDGRMSSINVRLRPGEVGVSVDRAALSSPAVVMTRLGDIDAGSKVAAARVADLRAIGYDVIPDPLPDNPAHALIVAVGIDGNKKDNVRRLVDAFAYVEPSS